MTINKEQLRLLIKANWNLRDASEGLEGIQKECDCCGRDSWTNLAEGRISREMGAILRKSEKCISLFKKELDIPKDEVGFMFDYESEKR
tara:strand:- start:61 stop:327 length:267 start_codon:yes stop_codon:yes gene_type:complete